MKSLSIILTITLSIVFNVTAQKALISFNSYRNWPIVDHGNISNDGEYVYYNIKNDSPTINSTVIVKSDSSWRETISDIEDPCFSEQGQSFLYKKGDSLFTLNLKSKKTTFKSKIQSYTTKKINGREIIVYLRRDSTLYIESLTGILLASFPNTKTYEISPNSETLIIKQSTSEPEIETMSWINIKDFSHKEIYSGPMVGATIFDQSSEQISFTTQTGENTNFWYYKKGASKAIELVNKDVPGLDSGFITTRDNWRFSPNGKLIIFSQTETVREATKPSNPEIWNYQDLYLVSFFKNPTSFRPRSFLTSVDIENRNIKRLINKGEEIDIMSFQNKDNPYFIFSTNYKLNLKVRNKFTVDYGICNILTGERKTIGRSDEMLNPTFSPDSKFLVYYKPHTHHFYAYHISSATENCISSTLDQPLLNNRFKNYPQPESYPEQIVGWIPSKSQVLVSDSYDIWSLDLTGARKPINLTNGQGRKERIKFYPIENTETNLVFQPRDNVILKAFNTLTKDFGYYSLKLNEKPMLTKLSMEASAIGKYMYKYHMLSRTQFVESKFRKGYLIRKEKFNNSPNYYYSRDLKKFTQLSNLQPQQKYNWLIAELHNYKDSLGNDCQGVLYKPEDFSATKKYPIVFNYYETYSNELNIFPLPEINGGDIDIAYLVSNGYLVFRPDIISEPEKAGQGALQSIVAALDHFSKYTWVNLNKVAMTGTSFGGWETNYIITHISRPIAAAVPQAANSDLISYSFSIARNGNDRFGYSQYGPFKLTRPFIEASDTYIKNSPLFSANNVNTPVLFMHNPNDKQGEVFQSQALFMQLRMLGKPAWLLSYPGEDHGLSIPANIIDYKEKLYSFLNHYLRDGAIPSWMTKHINAFD
ncbi:prolyl oligopeptidase family serine peptidase [Chitinophaga sp. 22536]|uniref:alpha/beta hydrolase family protein n=1 Tax=unclassified Chitinophaga TaxID=2619133 RepID=UPI003F8603EF